jgi:hypothetical protein
MKMDREDVPENRVIGNARAGAADTLERQRMTLPLQADGQQALCTGVCVCVCAGVEYSGAVLAAK